MAGAGQLLARGRLLIALGLCPLLLHLALLGESWRRMPAFAGALDTGLVIASAAPHTLIYLALLATFGASLRPGRDALITALAYRMYETVPVDMARYTRRVTWAWCGFFAAQLLTSLGLFLFAPVAVWSFFVNVLNLPLVALMFVAEQICRPFLLRDAPRHTAADMLRMIGHVRDGLWKSRSG